MNPWEMPAVDSDLIQFDHLPVDQQVGVTEAVQNAINLIAGPDPDRAAELERVAMRCAAHLLKSKSTGALFVAVEVPRLPAGFDQAKLEAAAYSSFVQSEFYRRIAVKPDYLKDELMLASVRRPVPLAEALQLLASESSPALELARRREEVTARVERERQAAADEIARRSEDDRRQALWTQRNGAQLARWGQASRLAQILALAAQDVPALRDVAALVLALEGKKGALTMPPWLAADDTDRLPTWAPPPAG